MKPYRLLLILAVGVVVGGLVLGSMARLGFDGAEARSAGLPTATAWMPASAGLVAYVDLASLLEGPLAQELEASRQAQGHLEQLEKFEDFTGVDPRTDLHSMSFSVNRPVATAGTGGGGPRPWGLALTGKFDPSAILAKIEGLIKLERIEHRGETLYLFPPAENRGLTERHAMAFPSRDIGLFGTPDHVKAMLDTGRGSEPSAADGALLKEWLDDMDDMDDMIRQETFWILGSMDAVRTLAKQRTEGMQLPPLQTFALSGRVGTDLKMTARGVTEDNESAMKLADLARGLVAMGSMNQQSSGPEILAILDSVQVQALDNRVEVSLAVPFETLRTLSRRQRSDPQQLP